MRKILLCWIGATDLRAANGNDDAGLGPIGQAAILHQHDAIVLLSDYPKDQAEAYVSWLTEKWSGQTDLQPVCISSPTHYGEIYSAAAEVVSQTIQKYGTDSLLTFHLSPGTPAMAAVWIILAKTRFPASLIESSKAHGVRTVSIPFDISAEFLPDLLKKPDRDLELLAAGLPVEAPEFEDIIHRSEAMQRVILKARKAAFRSIPVLVEGESGTGKELLARAIHDASPRKNKPFVAINCGAIPADLVESELFGHEKGAFTGASTSRIGHFEAADGGTIFLDELGELPKTMQVKLLRTLQEGELRRIGAAVARKVDVRIIAATNRNLIDEVASGNFREDLFYRIAVAVIRLPPLRERTGDIGLLIDTLIDRINSASVNEPGYKQKKISSSARNLLVKHLWPGNVRELQNTLTRAAVWSSREVLDEQDIQEALLPIPGAEKGKDQILNQPVSTGVNLPGIIKTVAVHYLQRGIAETHGNKTKTAELLGFPSYQTLTNWLKKYGLE